MNKLMKNISNMVMAAGLLTLVSCGSGGSNGLAPTENGFKLTGWTLTTNTGSEQCLTKGYRDCMCEYRRR